LSRLIRLVEEQGVLNSSRPLSLLRVPVTELVRTPEHGNVLETKTVTRALLISFVYSRSLSTYDTVRGPGVVPRSP
jgi:hypothetical protein